jgi:hypothetical protein
MRMQNPRTDPIQRSKQREVAEGRIRAFEEGRARV